MIKTLLAYLREIPCKRQFTNRNIKTYKFIPAPNKNGKKVSKLPLPTKIDKNTAEYLETISLVGFKNERVVQIVEEAITFADQIFEVDTENVKPLVTVLEDEGLLLREDTPSLDVTRDELLSQTKVSLENYYVTPVGNQEYVPEKKLFEDQSELTKVCEN